jgi:asparagine synthase (glutamine-hydrolysing)
MSALAREHGVKVLLTGDGSDELFGGYPWHSALSRLERIERVPGLHPILALLSRAPLPRPTHAKVRDLARKYRRSDVAKYHAQYDIFDGETRARLLGRSGGTDPLESLVEPLFEANHSTSLTERFALTELTLWVGEHFNQRLDRMAMAASVEGRVPFQDNAVVDLALAIPVADKIRAGHGKAPLRAAFSHCVPAAVMRRAKRPFAAPATAWMHGALRPLISTSLSPESLSRVLEIDPDVASTVLAPLRDGLPVRQERVWSLFHLVLWAEALKQPPVEVPPPFAVAGVPMTSERV